MLAMRRDDVLFWVVVLAGQAMALLVLLRSTMLGLAFIAGLGVLACLSLVLGTRRGTLLVGATLVAIAIVLPGDLSLRYRIPLGGGGVFIDDIFLALVVASAALTLLGERRFTVVRSPVTLPLALFLGWAAIGAVIGYLAGNDFKLILQDFRSLSYYLLFFWALLFVDPRTAHVHHEAAGREPCGRLPDRLAVRRPRARHAARVRGDRRVALPRPR